MFEESTGKIVIVNAHLATSVHGIEHSEEVGYPTKGVLYASNEEGCGENYTPYGPSYTEDTACGDIYVKGVYSKSLTVAAQNNIIITGSLGNETTTLTSNALLGLVANNFVRVQHKVVTKYAADHRSAAAIVARNTNAKTATKSSTENECKYKINEKDATLAKKGRARHDHDRRRDPRRQGLLHR